MTLYEIALALTVLVELIIIAVWWWFDSGCCDAWSLALFVSGINLITHPAAWMLHTMLGGHIVAVEMAVVFAEAFGLKAITGFSFLKSLVISLAMNAASATVGLLSGWAL